MAHPDLKQIEADNQRRRGFDELERVQVQGMRQENVAMRLVIAKKLGKRGDRLVTRLLSRMRRHEEP